MKNFKKVIIIGAGPVGLYLGNKFEDAKFPYLIIEASDHVGGQLMNLYPEKEIVDIPGINSIKAKEYIALLDSKINHENVHLNETVKQIEVTSAGVLVKTSKDEYECENLILATGLGFTKPRPLGVEHEEEVKNILYSLKDFSFLKGKRVAIFGGGDSALDWAKEISAISDDVHLIHRRLEFRGNPETIKDCTNLKVHLPYVPGNITLDSDLAKTIVINKVIQEGEEPESIEIPVDYILVNYGNIPSNTPFELNYKGAFIIVNESQEAKDHIFVVGDACDYENKKRRIAPGNKEADKVLELILNR